MARKAEGWHVFQDPRSEVYQVRFTHEGRRYSFSTGARDSGKASSEAAHIYAEIISGRWSAEKGLSRSADLSFIEVAAFWLESVESSIDHGTFMLYEDTYVATHFAPFFKCIDRLTTVGVEDYVASRLRSVSRETVKKEISALRQFARWAHRRGFLEKLPEIETPGRRVLGHVQASDRKKAFFVFTMTEMEAIISALPVFATSKRSGERFPVRARFELAWQYAWRPQTLNKLSVPEHYRPGVADITITADIDKNRWGRKMKVVADARDALDSVSPANGLIFGTHDFRTLLRKAAHAAGIDAYRADRISDYDFRHSRLTYLGQVTNNLSGVMYIAGHKQPATTARYMRPQRAAADEVLASAAAAGLPKSRPGSGSLDVVSELPLKTAADEVLMASSPATIAVPARENHKLPKRSGPIPPAPPVETTSDSSDVPDIHRVRSSA